MQMDILVNCIFIQETVSELQAQVQVYKMRIIYLKTQIKQNPFNTNKQQAEPNEARGILTCASANSDDIMHLANVETGSHIHPQQLRESVGSL